MSDAVVAAAPKVVKKKAAAKPKKPSNHPKYSEMIRAAVSSLKERGGSSRQAILKYILANFNVGKDEKVVNQHLKMALRAGAKNGSLNQSKGSGASGSFRIGEAAKKAPKKATKSPKKAKKPKAAKPKKAAKSPKKPKVAKPKKVKTPKKAAAKPKKAAAKPKKAAAKPKKAPKAKAAPKSS